MEKFIARAKVCGNIGGGKLNTIRAYNTYIIPVLSFVAQLENPPDRWPHYEMEACKLLFKGPTRWMSVNGLQNLSSLGFPVEIPPLSLHRLRGEEQGPSVRESDGGGPGHRQSRTAAESHHW